MPVRIYDRSDPTCFFSHLPEHIISSVSSFSHAKPPLCQRLFCAERHCTDRRLKYTRSEYPTVPNNCFTHLTQAMHCFLSDRHWDSRVDLIDLRCHRPCNYVKLPSLPVWLIVFGSTTLFLLIVLIALVSSVIISISLSMDLVVAADRSDDPIEVQVQWSLWLVSLLTTLLSLTAFGKRFAKLVAKRNVRNRTKHSWQRFAVFHWKQPLRMTLRCTRNTNWSKDVELN